MTIYKNIFTAILRYGNIRKVDKYGTVAENNKWKIKMYGPPREHGSPHVHVVAKGKNAEVKIYLETLEVEGKTKFSKRSVKQIIEYVYGNYDLLIEAWEAIHEKKK
jgi:hypothetical protein